MSAFLQANPMLTMGIFLFVTFCAMLIIILGILRHSERNQLKVFTRLRQDSETQSRTVQQLEKHLNLTVQQINDLSASMEARQDRLRRTMDERMALMNQSNDARLEQMRSVVSEKLDGRLNESFQLVNSELANVHRGLGEMRALSTGVTDLKKMLGNVKSRGVWGEVQLRTLMSGMFAPQQYLENVAIPAGSQTRVEFALKIPTAGDDAPLLPIDSKFPQEDYLRLSAAMAEGDHLQAEKCAQQLEKAVLEQARRISDKYIRPPQTTDFAVMFLPTESLYAEVVRREGLIEKLQQKYRVVAAGPATLCALLTSIQLGLRTCTLEKRSGEILSRMENLRSEFARFEEGVAQLHQRLDQAQSALDNLETRRRKIARIMDFNEDTLQK